MHIHYNCENFTKIPRQQFCKKNQQCG